MIRCALTALSVFAALLTAARAPAADLYTIDPAHTSVVFSVAHSGFSYTYGVFRDASGTYVIDKQNPANNRFRLIIKSSSLDTNHQKRDEHLRSPDFFNVQKFPEITFDSTKCVAATSPDGGVLYQVTGNLVMHGVTREITVPLRMLGEGTGPYGDMRTGFLCQIELKRSEFGMTNLLKDNLVGDAVGITVSFEGSLQQPGSPPAARPQ
jgi:polyisoprenoid-binding protein YceI